MALQWDASFEFGIDEIDQQHKTIVEQFNLFSESVQGGGGLDKLAETAEFLAAYAQSHFATEERYMTKYDYPKIDEQRREHDSFTQDAADLLKQLQAGEASREVAIALTGKMVRWVIQHVRNHDREMVAYVREKMNG